MADDKSPSNVRAEYYSRIAQKHLSPLWESLHSLVPTPRCVPFLWKYDDLRAHVLELSYAIACDIHPVNNLRILKYLQGQLGVSVEAKDAWYAHWIAQGMTAVEALLKRYGDAKGLTALASSLPWPIAAWCRKSPMPYA